MSTMNGFRRPGRLAAIAALTLLAGPALCAASVAADAPEPTGEVSYGCQVDGGATGTATPVTFSLSNAQSSVEPGGMLWLEGNLTLQLSDTEATTSQLELASNASITKSTFPLVVTIGSTTQTIKPNVVVGMPSLVTTPWKVTAHIGFPAVPIPAGASGEVKVLMPIEQNMAATVTGATTMASFTSVITQDSAVVETRNVDCAATDRGPKGTIASIPIQAAAATGAGAKEHNAKTPSAPLAGAPAAAPMAPLAPLPADAPVDAGVALGAPAAAPAATIPLAQGYIPAATVTGKTFIPAWLLVMLIAIGPGLALAYAIRQNRRLRAQLAQTPSVS